MAGRLVHGGRKFGRIASCSTLVTPKLEPARDGLTNSGYCKPASLTCAMIASASVLNSEALSKERASSVMPGATGMPAAASSTFV